jgi:uncharacterized protein YbjT (DUF2867 family)
MLLITGATGTVGREVVRRLSAQGVQVRAVTRDPRKAGAAPLPHVQFVQGDFEDPESMRRACSGVERAFLLSNSTERAEQQQIAFTRIAEESGVRHLVKLSQLHADTRSPGRFLRGRDGRPGISAHVHVSAPESLHAGSAELPAEYPGE